MNNVFRGNIFAWIMVILLCVASYVFIGQRLSFLPQLGVFLGPDLTVRAVSVERHPTNESHQFQRGDRIIAVHRQAVHNLRDIRAIVPNFMGDGQDDIDTDELQMDYQMMRPLHRFTLVLQGEHADPTKLPAGIEPDDRLIQIDERPLPGKVGTEGLRSIISSRPEAILGFERSNAVFSGQITIRATPLRIGLVLGFGLALLTIVLLGRFYNDRLSPLSPLVTGVETIFVAWLLLLVFEYQWLISDYLLTAGVIAALIMVRPMAIFARDVSAAITPIAGYVSLFIGTLASALVIGLLYSNRIGNAEDALHVAAIITGLFIVYELVVTGFEKNSSVRLGDKSGYLTGIVLLCGFACVMTVFSEPVLFEEDRWRWFAMMIPSLLWFGDALYCHSGGHAHNSVSLDEGIRHSAIDRYFEHVEEVLSDVSVELYLYQGQRVIQLISTDDGIVAQNAPDEISDALTILSDENVMVPLPEGAFWQSHPMSGIAAALNWVLAVPLARPDFTIDIKNTQVILVGRKNAGIVSAVDYPANDIIDMLSQRFTQQMWDATVLEGMQFIASHRAIKPPQNLPQPEKAELSTDSDASLVEPTTAVSGSVVNDLQQELQDLRAIQNDVLKQEIVLRYARGLQSPSLDTACHLLEPELIDGLRYLLETPEPIVLGGRAGAGKYFVAWTSHLLEHRLPEWFISYNCTMHEPEQWMLHLFGADEDNDNESVALTALCEDGALAIENSQRLTDEIIQRLIDESKARAFRLYLLFNDHDAEQTSVLTDRNDSIKDYLGEREIIIPALVRRHSIKTKIFEYFLIQSSLTTGKDIIGFSEDALNFLCQHDFIGDIEGARLIIYNAVRNTSEDFIGLNDCQI